MSDEESMVAWITHLENGNVHIMARLEGEGGLLGDVSHEVGPGQTFFGIPYDELKKVVPGCPISLLPLCDKWEAIRSQTERRSEG